MKDLKNSVVDAIYHMGAGDLDREAAEFCAGAAVDVIVRRMIGDAGVRVVVSDRDDHVADGIDLCEWLAEYLEADHD